jgi:hypothetical protein
MLSPTIDAATNGALLQRRREEAASIMELAAHLRSADRSLLEAIYERGFTAAQLARAQRRSPRTYCDRVMRLLERMNSPAFRYVLRHAEDWPPQRARIARAVFLRGEGQRRTAAALRVSVHRVRREVERIRALAENEQ